MAVTIEELEKGYDDILHKVIQKLKELLGQLLREKAGTQKLMEDIKREVEVATEEFDSIKTNKIFAAKLKDEAKKRGMDNGVLTEFDDKLRTLENELGQLLTQEVFEYNQERVSYEQEKKSVDNDLAKIKGLIDFIERVAGKGASIVTAFGTKKSKKKPATLTSQQLEAAHNEVRAVYADLQKRGIESARLRAHISPMEERIKKEAQDKLTKLRGLIEEMQNKINRLKAGGSMP